MRIGLSATQAPIEDIAGFLGGYEKNKPRPVNIVDVRRKHLDLKVLCPVDDLTLPPEIINSKMYDMLVDLIKDHEHFNLHQYKELD